MVIPASGRYEMSTYRVDLPARRTAWLADDAYQVRLTEQARTLAALQGQVRPTRLRLEAASMPETYENAQLAERDDVRVQFSFRETEVPVRRMPRRFGLPDGFVCIAIIAAWQRHDAILPGNAKGDPVKNVIKVDVDPQNVTLWVNAAKVLAVRADLRADGRVGFRVGRDMNLHITTLNVTRKFAPVPVKKG